MEQQASFFERATFVDRKTAQRYMAHGMKNGNR
jgi:hypothetical protein